MLGRSRLRWRRLFTSKDFQHLVIIFSLCALCRLRSIRPICLGDVDRLRDTGHSLVITCSRGDTYIYIYMRLYQEKVLWSSACNLSFALYSSRVSGRCPTKPQENRGRRHQGGVLTIKKEKEKQCVRQNEGKTNKKTHSIASSFCLKHWSLLFCCFLAYFLVCMFYFFCIPSKPCRPGLNN